MLVWKTQANILKNLTTVISKIIPGSQNSQIGEILRHNKRLYISSNPRLVTAFFITDQLSLSTGSFHLKKSPLIWTASFPCFSRHRFIPGEAFIFTVSISTNLGISDLHNLTSSSPFYWNCSWPHSTTWHCWPFFPLTLWLERYNTTHMSLGCLFQSLDSFLFFTHHPVVLCPVKPFTSW